MKTKLTLVFTLFSLFIFAQRVATVHGASGVQAFHSADPFQDAYAAAVNGDTIYLPGGNMSVPAMFDKSVFIYGAGYHPDSTSATMKTTLSGGISLREDASYSHFEGIEFLGSVTTPTNEAINYISFKRCYFNQVVNYNGSAKSASNNSFMECIFIDNVEIRNSVNSSFHNCIFQNHVRYSYGNYFANNIFLRNASLTYANVFLNSDYNTIQNNVFRSVGDHIISTYSMYSCTGNMVYNNLFVAENPNYGGNSISGGNFINIDPNDVFVDQTGYIFDFEHDYNLQDPSLFLGNDGDEVGIYGGIFPFKAGGIPLNPHIQMKNIANQTNNNGELEIEIQVEAQND
jgi:hypothetical protein